MVRKLSAVVPYGAYSIVQFHLQKRTKIKQGQAAFPVYYQIELNNKVFLEFDTVVGTGEKAEVFS